MSLMLIKGGRIVTMDAPTRDLPQGDVLVENDRIAAIGPALTEWTTIHGARVAALDHRTGSLAIGKQADIIFIRSEDISMFPVRDPIGSIVMQGGVATVDTVLIAGRMMKRKGRLVYPRLAERMAELRRSGDRILTDFGYLPRRAA